MTTLRASNEPAAWQGSEAAAAAARSPDVAQAVREHADWVYSAALRMVKGRADLAGDVTQAVFLLLWRRPEKAQGKSLTGWLFQVTRYCAANALRAERRRARHERRAAAMKSETASTPDDQQLWAHIAPILDELVATLRAGERELVLLRFYQGKSMAQIGSALGISEEAARKRVACAVDKLRRKLHRRGVTSPGELAVAAAITAHVTHVSPGAVTAAALNASATGASAQVLALAKGATTTMLIAKVKAVAAVLIVAVGIGTAAIATPLMLAQAQHATPTPALAVATAPTSRSPAATSEDDAIMPFLNARTNMLDAIDAFAIDWDAVDAARDQLQSSAAGAARNVTPAADGPRVPPIFSHQMTAIYRRWTRDFRDAGGTRIYLISQVGIARENPGAFELFSMTPTADPGRVMDVCTPSSHAAQQFFEPLIVGRTVVAANHRMVTALATQKAEPRPDVMDALRASRMPVRIVWLPQQCRQGGRPSVSNTSIDFGTDTAFSGAEWDKVVWMTKGYTPPPKHAAEIIIKCQDAASARAMRDWIAQLPAAQKRGTSPNAVNFGSILKMHAANDQVQIVNDPTPTERIWLLGNTFNVAP